MPLSVQCVHRLQKICPLDALSKGLLFTFVLYVHWFPDIRLKFAVQSLLIGNLRLAILDRLFPHGLADHAAAQGFDPKPHSGRQELAESIIARHCRYLSLIHI